MLAKSSDRTEKIIGTDGLNRLARSSVLVVGLGGVGGCVFEMLLRAGIGRITVVDGDRFEITNLNRQILSTVDNIGTYKTDAAVLRAKLVAPDCVVTEKRMRYNGETADEIFTEAFDCVADCIDSVADKTHLIVRSQSENIKIISAMGSGNRLSPDFKATDIYSTQGDGLARVMRKKLKEAGVKKLTVICDTGLPQSVAGTPGTISYAPNMSGLIMAKEIIGYLLCK